VAIIGEKLLLPASCRKLSEVIARSAAKTLHRRAAGELRPGLPPWLAGMEPTPFAANRKIDKRVSGEEYLGGK